MARLTLLDWTPPAEEEASVRRTWLALRDALDHPDEENLRRLVEEMRRAGELERREAN